ncbi:hypothetical protein GF325_05060 [Candidatus Bathyarchaeota archaeon]|nr:hypothetical protein [Candidatus Bathyarchaeota archaeon]
MLQVREITIFVIFPIVAVLFIILGALILRRDKRYLANQAYTIFFWSVGIGLLFNVIYVIFPEENLIIAFNLTTTELVNAGFASLLLATLVIYKGEKIVQESIQIKIIMLGIAIACVILGLIPGGIYVIMNDALWSVAFGTMELILTQGILLACVVISLTIIKDLGPEMKRKFLLYIIGIVFLNITFFGTAIDNMNFFPEIHDVFSYLNILVIIGTILIYFGIVRRTESH